jgi:hypothetical protein
MNHSMLISRTPVAGHQQQGHEAGFHFKVDVQWTSTAQWTATL